MAAAEGSPCYNDSAMLQVWGIISFVAMWLFIGACGFAILRVIRRLEAGVAEQKFRQGL